MKKRILSFMLVLSMLASVAVTMPMTASATANIKLGDYVQMGQYYGKPILWRCVDIDENGPLMLSDKILCLKAFDASGTNTSGSHGRGYYSSGKQGYYRQKYGSNYWADSNIRDWLNSTAGSGGVIWTCGNPPTKANSWGYNGYENEAGFLSNFTQSEQNAIKTVTQKSLLDRYEHSDSSNNYNSNYHRYDSDIDDVVQNYDSAYSEQVTDKMFLLDVKQINKVYQNLGSYYIGYPTEEAVANSDYTSSNLTTKPAWWSWLRSPRAYGDSGDGVRYVDAVGYVDYYCALSGSGGVRPAFYLNLSSCTITGGSGTEGSPYTIEGSGSVHPEVTPKLYISDDQTIKVGQQCAVKAGLSGELEATADIKFTVDGPNVVSITPSSPLTTVTGLSPGTATITATYGGESVSCKVTVEPADAIGLNIYSNAPYGSVFAGDQFMVGAKVVLEDRSTGSTDGISFSVEDSSIISAGNTTVKNGILFCTFMAKKCGTTKIKVSDSLTGKSGTKEFTVNNVKNNAYTVNSMPFKINNYNGIKIENFNSRMNSNGSCNISFTALNRLPMHGAVEVYNADGKLVKVKKIEKNQQLPEGFKDTYDMAISVWDDLMYAIDRDIENFGRETSYKETKIELSNVPKGGSINITTDIRHNGCLLINAMDLTLQFIGYGKDIKDKLSKDLDEKDLETKFAKELFKKTGKDFIGKLNSDDITKNFRSVMSEVLNDEETINDFIKICGKSGASVTLSEIKKVLSKSGGYAGIALKAIFSVDSYLNTGLQMGRIKQQSGSGALSIQVPDNDTRTCSNITVKCDMDDDVALDVYIISKDEAKKYLRDISDIYNQNVSPDKPKSRPSDVEIMGAYDISLVIDNEVYSPNGNVTVVMQLPDELKGKMGEMYVYRREDNGTFTAIKGYSDGECVTFQTKHFSVYLLADVSSEIKDLDVDEGQTVVSGNTIVSEWAAEEIEQAFDEDIIPEVLIGEDLTKQVSRAEFAAIAVQMYENLSGDKATAVQNPFADISGNGCKEDILKAYNLNITTGTSNITFDPDVNITREQVATMLTRAYKKSEFDGWSLANDGNYPLNFMGVQKFADDNEISDYAKESVYFMVRWNVINGIGNNMFAPKGNVSLGEAYGFATREQAVCIALRSAKYLK